MICYNTRIAFHVCILEEYILLDEFRKLSQHFLEIKNQSYKRYFIQKTKLTERLSILIGQRGIGKTTTVIQYLMAYAGNDRFKSNVLYIQADHFQMGDRSLYEIAEQFVQLGGELIAFDEIHKYPNWSIELKSIYDTFPSLKIIASGSSALEVHKGSHDLSRRAIVYRMYGMSFREYLELYYGILISSYSLDEILKDHEKITDNIIKVIAEKNKKILSLFVDYINHGYYPYFREVNDQASYSILLEQNLHTIIESDLIAIYPHLTGNSVKKIKQLLSFIAHAVPFTPHWQKLKSLLEIGDDRTLKTYFKYLEDAELIQSISKSSKKLHKLESPEKIYLNNTNQLIALSYDQHNKGTIRETFFLNIISTQHEVTLPVDGDFLIDEKYLFEIGGRKKGFGQVKNAKNAYIAIDETEQGIGAKIPLWLFGFLY